MKNKKIFLEEKDLFIWVKFKANSVIERSLTRPRDFMQARTAEMVEGNLRITQPPEGLWKHMPVEIFLDLHGDSLTPQEKVDLRYEAVNFSLRPLSKWAVEEQLKLLNKE